MPPHPISVRSQMLVGGGVCRADSRIALSQWETALLCNGVSHWLGASLESALYMSVLPVIFFETQRLHRCFISYTTSSVQNLLACRVHGSHESLMHPVCKIYKQDWIIVTDVRERWRKSYCELDHLHVHLGRIQCDRIMTGLRSTSTEKDSLMMEKRK